MCYSNGISKILIGITVLHIFVNCDDSNSSQNLRSKRSLDNQKLDLLPDELLDNPTKRRGWGKRSHSDEDSLWANDDDIDDTFNFDDFKRRGWGKRAADLDGAGDLKVQRGWGKRTSDAVSKRRGWGKRDAAAELDGGKRRGWGKRSPSSLDDVHVRDALQLDNVGPTSKRRGWGKRADTRKIFDFDTITPQKLHGMVKPSYNDLPFDEDDDNLLNSESTKDDNFNWQKLVNSVNDETEASRLKHNCRQLQNQIYFFLYETILTDSQRRKYCKSSEDIIYNFLASARLFQK